jgi:hypothetical protein
MSKQKGPGRPQLPESEKRKPAFLVKLTKAEFDLIKQVAKPRVGTWARIELLKAANQAKKRASGSDCG